MPAPFVVTAPSASHASGRHALGDNGIELRVSVPQHDAGPLSLLSLLRGAIDALARNDVAELHRLLDSLDAMWGANSGGEGVSGIAQIAASIPAADLSEVRRLHRRLGTLLRRTERNLRLLRRTSALSMAANRNAALSAHSFETSARSF